MVNLVIGLGETGKPLFDILKDKFPNTMGYDPKVDEVLPFVSEDCILHICIPYSESFVNVVGLYQETYSPHITVIHSTVPIGTTSKIKNAVHSPIIGRHNRMKSDMLKYLKWIGGQRNEQLVNVFREAGFRIRHVSNPEETEALKLLCLAKYGMSIAFAHYCKKIADEYSFDLGYHDVYSWDADINSVIEPQLRRPMIVLKDEKIGGHCVIQNTKILNGQHPNQILDEVLKYE